MQMQNLYSSCDEECNNIISNWGCLRFAVSPPFTHHATGFGFHSAVITTSTTMTTAAVINVLVCFYSCLICISFIKYSDCLYGLHMQITVPAHVVQWSNHLGAMCSRA